LAEKLLAGAPQSKAQTLLTHAFSTYGGKLHYLFDIITRELPLFAPGSAVM
jgi:hypothetical protein